MSAFAVNVRRLMAREGLTLGQLVEAAGLHPRTLKRILNGTSRPHARTLHRLAAGLGVETDELFQSPSPVAHRLFDRRTNPAVQDVIDGQPELFEGWSPADFDELFSHVGNGGALTESGTAEMVRSMNAKRVVLRKAALVLESCQADLLIGFVELLYQKITVSDASNNGESTSGRSLTR